VSAVRYADLAADLLAGPPAAGSCRVVAVDGPSGAGKTTWAGRLAGALGARLLHMDEIYPGWDGLAAAVPHLRGEVLAPIAEGRAARYRRYDWVRQEYGGPWRELPPAPALVVEGVGAGALAVADLLACLVWVDAPLAVRYERSMARDGEAYRPHWERWARQETAYFAADRPRDRADLLVDGDPVPPCDATVEFVALRR
jgi:hypothetical protein